MSTKGQRFRPEVLTPAEVDRLLRTTSLRAPTGIRNRALIVIGYRAGLRLSEVLGLELKDVDLDAGMVYVRNGKGGKARKIGLDAQACSIVQRWVDKRRELGLNGAQRLFCTLKGAPVNTVYVRTLLPRLGRKAGIEKRVHYHGLRHTYAWEHSKEGVPVKVIQGLLGHARLETTAVYLAHLAPHDLIEVAHKRPTWGEGL